VTLSVKKTCKMPTVKQSAFQAEESFSDDGLMQRKDKNTGEFARFPLVMQMKTIKKIARKYKIALKDEDGKPIKVRCAP